jgi:hypothetical protein
MKYHQKLETARNPNTAPKILQQLATDGLFLVRLCVAQNPNTPTKSLELLATDKDYLIRKYVSQNPNCNQIIERLVFMTNYQENQ